MTTFQTYERIVFACKEAALQRGIKADFFEYELGTHRGGEWEIELDNIEEQRGYLSRIRYWPNSEKPYEEQVDFPVTLLTTEKQPELVKLVGAKIDSIVKQIQTTEC